MQQAARGFCRRRDSGAGEGDCVGTTTIPTHTQYGPPRLLFFHFLFVRRVSSRARPWGRSAASRSPTRSSATKSAHAAAGGRIERRDCESSAALLLHRTPVRLHLHSPQRPLPPPACPDWHRLIDKEDTARRNWKARYGQKFASGAQGWRPVEPFEREGASDAKTELPSAVPVSAIRNPPLYRDTVGNEGLAGGTPLRFGGQWDVVSQKVERWQDPNKAPRQVKKGPHDCYCDVGYNCWNMAGKARTANYGLMGTFEKEFWTNTPGELALVWDYSKERAKQEAASAPAPAAGK